MKIAILYKCLIMRQMDVTFVWGREVVENNFVRQFISLNIFNPGAFFPVDKYG